MLKCEKYTLKSKGRPQQPLHSIDGATLEDIWSPEGGLCQEAGGVVTVLHVGHGDGGVGHPVEHHRVHRHRHRVLGQDLARLGFAGDHLIN